MGTDAQASNTQSISAAETLALRSWDRTPRGGRIGGPVRSLPRELEFIVQHGVSADRILSALDAAPLHVDPLDVLLGEGVILEEEYYEALARHLGCEYYLGAPSFAADFDALNGLRSGVAPLATSGRGPRAVIAPRANSVPRLIEMTISGRLHPESFAVTSPHRFASLVRIQHGDVVLGDALGRLPTTLCARGGMSRGQIAAAGVIASTAFALGTVSIHLLTGVLSMALWLIFSSSILLRSAVAMAHDDKVGPPMLSDDELPVYTVVAAIYREAGVIDDLIRAFDTFDYPRTKLDIKLVAERRDEETISRLLAMRLPARYELIIAPPGEPSTKPRALNIALAAARGELLAVYDAEDSPAADQLRLAASVFASENDLDCLQARLTIRNSEDSWFSKLFAVEYAALFDLINPGLCALEMPIALGGTSNHFRVATLLGVGGWDEWNVAEDADPRNPAGPIGQKGRRPKFGHVRRGAPRILELVLAARTLAEGVDADLHSSFTWAVRPCKWPSKAARGLRRHLDLRLRTERYVLAGVRCGHVVPRVWARKRSPFALAGGHRCLHLYPCGRWDMGDAHSGDCRSQNSAAGPVRADSCTGSSLLFPGFNCRLDRCN